MTAKHQHPFQDSSNPPLSPLVLILLFTPWDPHPGCWAEALLLSGSSCTGSPGFVSILAPLLWGLLKHAHLGPFLIVKLLGMSSSCLLGKQKVFLN